MRPYIVAVTGSIASGKSTVCGMLKTLGETVVDADGISHLLTMSGGAALPLIKREFGEGVFLTDGSLSRKALGAVVFGNEEKRRALEGILHPLIRSEMEREIAEAGKTRRIVFLDVPLLYESGFDKMAEEVWCVYLGEREQLRRLTLRDNISEADALLRIKSQMPAKEKMERADRVIRTDYGFDETEKQTRALLSALYTELEAADEHSTDTKKKKDSAERA